MFLKVWTGCPSASARRTRARTALDGAIVDEELEVSLEHLEVLVLVAMGVGRMPLVAGLACILEYRAPYARIASSLEGDVHAFHQHVGSPLARSNYSGFGHDCGLLLRAQSSQRVVHPFHESMMPSTRAPLELQRISSMTTLRRGEHILSKSRLPFSAESTTLLISGSKASMTPCSSAVSSASCIAASMSRQASGVPLSVCRRHMSSLSRAPVHSVIVDLTSRSQAPAITPRRRSRSRRISSGCAMLKVPETAATVTSRLAQASRTRSARAGSISSGMEVRPATDMLNC